MRVVKFLNLSVLVGATFLLSVFSFSLPASAQSSVNPCPPPSQGFLEFPTWYKNLPGKDDGTGKCVPQFEGLESSLAVGLALLEIGLVLGGLVAVVIVFIGGFKYVISQGESEKAAGARKTVLNAVIGLVIIMLSVRIVSYLGGRLG